MPETHQPIDGYITYTLVWWAFFSCYCYATSNLKLAINFQSLTHASLVILAYLVEGNPAMLYYLSAVYYVVDTIFTMLTIQNWYGAGLVVHHVLTIWCLQYMRDGSDVAMTMYTIFFLAELSNLPMYYVEHLRISRCDNRQRILSGVAIQLVTTVVIRLILGGVVIGYLAADEFPFIIIASGIVIYTLSSITVYDQAGQLGWL